MKSFSHRYGCWFRHHSDMLQRQVAQESLSNASVSQLLGGRRAHALNFHARENCRLRHMMTSLSWRVTFQRSRDSSRLKLTRARSVRLAIQQTCLRADRDPPDAAEQMNSSDLCA